MDEIGIESPPNDPLMGSLSPVTKLAAKRAALRRNSERSLTSRDGSSTFSIPPPPNSPYPGSPSTLNRWSLDKIPPPPSPSPRRAALGRSGSSGLLIAAVAARSRAGSKDSSKLGEDLPPSPSMRPSRLEEVVLRKTPTIPKKTLQQKTWDERRVHARGWDLEKGVPTQNLFVLRAMLEGEKEPWKNRALHLMTPHQMSSIVEGLYCSTASMHAAVAYRPLPMDCVVCGVPRSGQSPVIQVLCSLNAKKLIENQIDLVESVTWLEGAYTNAKMLHQPGQHLDRRILKTYLPIRMAIGGDASHSSFSRMHESFRGIVVLRNPFDLRLSWFRHVRRVFNKYNPTLNFDQHFRLDDFAKVTRGALQPVMRAMFDFGDDYEHYVLDVLKTYEAQLRNPRHILIVFYEEILTNPLAFVRRVAEHVDMESNKGIDEQLIQAIVDSIESSALNPQSGKRTGSGSFGRETFSSKSVDYINSRWLDVVGVSFRDYSTYEQLYEAMTNSKYPFKNYQFSTQSVRKSSAPRMSTSGPRGSSLLGFFRKRNSNLPQQAMDETKTDAPKQPTDPDDSSSEDETFTNNSSRRKTMGKFNLS